MASAPGVLVQPHAEVLVHFADVHREPVMQKLRRVVVQFPTVVKMHYKPAQLLQQVSVFHLVQGYSETRDGASRRHCTEVDATIRERRP